MAVTKNVRKLSSDSANELLAIDIAERDAQGRKIISTYATKGEIPTALPADGGNADYATTAGNASTCNNHTLGCDVPANADFTNTWPSAYITSISKSGNTLTITPNSGSAITFTNTTYSNATTSAAGLMSATDKTKLDGLNGSNYLAKAGGTMTGRLKWADSSALPSATAAGLTGGLQYILGIKAFADGGDTVYETKANFLSGCVFYTAQTLTDAQKAQARTNIGAETKKYTHNVTVYLSGGSGSNYRRGSLTFSFQDTNANSYATTGLTEAQFRDFLTTHCGMTAGKKFPINGTVQIGSPITELWFLTNMTATSGSLWYVGGSGISVNSSKAITSIYAANEEINYLTTAINGLTMTLYDVVL